ncbi:g693 [Coccomyxa elongata]
MDHIHTAAQKLALSDAEETRYIAVLKIFNHALPHLVRLRRGKAVLGRDIVYTLALFWHRDAATQAAGHALGQVAGTDFDKTPPVSMRTTVVHAFLHDMCERDGLESVEITNQAILCLQDSLQSLVSLENDTSVDNDCIVATLRLAP